MTDDEKNKRAARLIYEGMARVARDLGRPKVEEDRRWLVDRAIASFGQGGCPSEEALVTRVNRIRRVVWPDVVPGAFDVNDLRKNDPHRPG